MNLPFFDLNSWGFSSRHHSSMIISPQLIILLMAMLILFNDTATSKETSNFFSHFWVTCKYQCYIDLVSNNLSHIDRTPTILTSITEFSQSGTTTHTAPSLLKYWFLFSLSLRFARMQPIQIGALAHKISSTGLDIGYFFLLLCSHYMPSSRIISGPLFFHVRSHIIFNALNILKLVFSTHISLLINIKKYNYKNSIFILDCANCS